MSSALAGQWTGQLLPRTKYLVLQRGTSTAATIYADRAKTAAADNTFTTDALGRGGFFAEPGGYTISSRARNSQIPNFDVTVYADPVDVLNVGFVVPLLGLVTGATAGMVTANDGHYVRVKSGGTISKVGLQMSVQSGNICVAAYANAGTGRAAAPTGGRLASSGSTPTPGAGYQEISLGATVTLQPGDWLGVSFDNITATCQVYGNGTTTDLYKGVAYLQATAFPLPATPSSLVASTSRTPVLAGV